MPVRHGLDPRTRSWKLWARMQLDRKRIESGASSHEAYKSRQHERVRMRLFRDKDDQFTGEKSS